MRTGIRCLDVHQARCASRPRIRRPNSIQGPKTIQPIFAQDDRVNDEASSSSREQKGIEEGAVQTLQVFFF
jgi:hypothetical protein